MAAESLNESITGLGPLGNFANDAAGAGAFKTFNLLISQIVAFLTVGGAIWFIIQIFIGALGWLSAGGDKQPLETAKKRILDAVTGLIILVLAYSFIYIVGNFLGINVLDPYSAFKQFGPLSTEDSLKLVK
ncbi:MAG: hypothetical protein UY27_C0023G0020 [Candidatus Gottesmanbacteria bacterium GW2011_GWA1_48_13]|uniref:Integral membrane protein n=1 Tax=Candidatus Gottesmanbacteria bacterium GW2011_GWA1_48_13 TaxID=1618439 RepID=A0A0G1UM60_9BACT|nr:MAG: hypothetical protein UY27_C0023G0020 [Candidatus Gottesmanbacteria bacterium GW2011_GWA1_48_13]